MFFEILKDAFQTKWFLIDDWYVCTNLTIINRTFDNLAMIVNDVPSRNYPKKQHYGTQIYLKPTFLCEVKSAMVPNNLVNYSVCNCMPAVIDFQKQNT